MVSLSFTLASHRPADQPVAAMLLCVEMENVTRGLPARRTAGIVQVGVRYGFGYLFGRRLLKERLLPYDLDRVLGELWVRAQHGKVFE